MRGQMIRIYKHLLQLLFQITQFNRGFILYAVLASHSKLQNRLTQNLEQFLKVPE